MRFPFSVRRLLAFTAFTAIGVSQVLLLWKNAALTSEVSVLRQETGRLTIIDYDKVNLINVPTNDPLVHKWRIYAPPGTFFDAGIETEAIPLQGVMDAKCYGMQIDVAEDGMLVTAAITEGLDGQYNLSLSLGNGNVYRSKTALPPTEWLEGSSSRMVAGTNGVRVYGFDEPIILFRVRLMEQVNSTTKREPNGESRGTLIWIVPRESP